MTPDATARLQHLLDIMLAMARQDFEAKAKMTGDDDVIDAIAVGLNMLGEELRFEVASRRELERAHEELKQAQAQLVHAGKLAAIGQLSAGIAHEINNPIQGIQVCLSIVQRTQRALRDGLAAGTIDMAEARRRIEQSDASIADANEAIDRVRGVTMALRTFARADDEAFTTVQLDEVVRVSCRLGESTAKTRALVELDLLPVPPVRGSRGKLGQVVTNLLVNAIQALPEGDAAHQTIRVRLRSEGGEVRLSVDDSGPGVPDALRQQIFDPFFTTKPDDVGTGLGLALVAEIVRAHQGSIHVGTSDLGGASFTVHLPSTTATAARVDHDDEPVRSSRRPRVLLVDDEAMLLRLFESLLADQCDVVARQSGREARELLLRDRSFDLVVCDLHLPDTDGADIYDAVSSFAPELAARFVFVTGGATTARGRELLAREGVRVLQKPFRVSALLALLPR